MYTAEIILVDIPDPSSYERKRRFTVGVEQ